MAHSECTTPTIEGIENALHVLLIAYVEHRRRDRCDKPQLLRMSDIGDENTVELMEMLHDPLGSVYHQGMRQLGQALYDLLKAGRRDTIRGMQASLYAVAERNPSFAGVFGPILDKAWDGVGRGDDIWIA